MEKPENKSTVQPDQQKLTTLTHREFFVGGQERTERDAGITPKHRVREPTKGETISKTSAPKLSALKRRKRTQSLSTDYYP